MQKNDLDIQYNIITKQNKNSIMIVHQKVVRYFKKKKAGIVSAVPANLFISV